jgi:hypothetical protein
MPRISVVVPIFDVESYLATCLQSLARQTVRDLEVIMVDDGSTDGSRALGERFAYHDRRFHLVAQPNGWAWLVLYAVFPPSVLVLLGRQLRTPGTEPARSVPIPGPLMLLLALQGVAMVALGTALVIAPADAASLWPWQVTPLTGRAIGTFVLAQGVLALTVCRERDWSRVRPAMFQFVVVGTLQLVAVARFSDSLDWDRAGAWIYLAFVVSVLAVGAYGAVRARRRS